MQLVVQSFRAFFAGTGCSGGEAAAFLLVLFGKAAFFPVCLGWEVAKKNTLLTLILKIRKKEVFFIIANLPIGQLSAVVAHVPRPDQPA